MARATGLKVASSISPQSDGAKRHLCIGTGRMIFRATEKSIQANVQLEVPLDETGVEFDEDKIDRIVSDVCDEAHLNARRAIRGKYE